MQTRLDYNKVRDDAKFRFVTGKIRVEIENAKHYFYSALYASIMPRELI
jgi:hypothetical protein